ncbi:hypothetical protein [Yoonia sp. SDW83-1]|uniref:hypothetical protein n=1 Tax=Yoonia sp. SDW83-1 TaxID=3366945 RepID=UPI00398C4EAA
MLTDIAQVCREIGAMIAQIETSLIDAAQDTGTVVLPRQSMQQIDLVMQSVEEVALLMERSNQMMPTCARADIEKIIGPTRLEWIRNRLSTALPDNGRATRTGEVSLF